jgi:hypothetical protein
LVPKKVAAERRAMRAFVPVVAWKVTFGIASFVEVAELRSR